MRRALGFFDWRFFLCFMGAALAVGFILALFVVALDNNAKGERLDRQAVQIDRLIDQNAELMSLSEADRAAQAESQRQLRALLVYIRAHGYYIPASLIPAEASGSDTIRAESDAERSRRTGGGGSPKASSPTGRDSGSTGGSGGSSGGSNGSGNGKSDDKPAKPEKDHGGNSKPKPDKGHDKPEKAKGKK